MGGDSTRSDSRGTARITPRNVHALVVEMPRGTARYFDAIANSARGISVNEYVPFGKGGRYVMLAVPALPLLKAVFLAEYSKLVVEIDGAIRVHLADYPRLFSHLPGQVGTIRGVPTLVPEDVFPRGFAGTAHDFELLRDGKRIFGPVRWLVPDERTGPIFSKIRGGAGKNQLTIFAARTDFKLMVAVLFSDPLFGRAVRCWQVSEEGSSIDLSYSLHGVDVLGDRTLFNEGYIEGFHAGFGWELKIVVQFERPGTGFAGVVSQAITKARALSHRVAVPS